MDPILIRWDRAVIHRDPTDPDDTTYVCCTGPNGQPYALALTDAQIAELTGDLTGSPVTLAPHRSGRRRRVLHRTRT